MRSNLLKVFALTLALLILTTCSPNISAQTTANTVTASNVARVTQAVKENDRVTLKGNTHPLASVKNDQGFAPDSLPMDRMLLVLKRSADQEASLKTLMEGQQSKSSPNFHQWLTPDQFGNQFGVSDSDIQTVTAWLQTHGFTVNRVATGKTLIEFSGTAGQVREAFQTQIHKYAVNGEQHWANSSDPTIPSALAAVVAGVNTLHNFKKKAAIHSAHAIPLPASAAKGKPQITLSNCNINSQFSNPVFSNTCFGVGPADFAAIYNIPAGATGAGQTVAIISDSDICTIGGAQTVLPAGCLADDVLAFRTFFGLPGNNTQVLVDGNDPGLNSDELEADLDVEWVGAVAPNATVLFVTASDTEASAGIDLAAERVVDNNLAPVLNESFGQCELVLGNTGNQFFNALWEQAAAEGITVNISTGDSASAGCDNDNTQSVAIRGTAVNGIASTPFAVAVGGTDFNYAATNYPSAFWNTTNGTHSVSAKGYIPETPWNDSCGQNNGQSLTGSCANLPSSENYLLNIAGGGGGSSGCALVQGGECFGYATPPWQTGLGVPTSGFRYLPDVSLFAADGLVSNSFYFVCESDAIAPIPSCSGPGSNFIPVGGTSASVQVFGAIVALVNQAMANAGKSARQGNASYALYPLFAAQTPGNLVFNDITVGTNSVPCSAGSPNCSPTTLALTQLASNGTLTSTPAYVATPGFDQATGLGSINVGNLITSWVNETSSFAPTSTTLCLSLTQNPAPTNCTPATNPLTFQHGTNVFVGTAVTSTAGGTLCGDVSLIGTGSFPSIPPSVTPTAGVDHFNAVTGNSDIYPMENSAGACTGSVQSQTNELVGGSYIVTAHFPGYNNGGSGKLFGVSDSSGINVNITPEASTTILSILDTNLLTGGVTSLSSGSSILYGGALTLRADVCSTATCKTTAPQEDGTGNITITDISNTLATLPLNSEGYTELNTPMFNFPGNLPSVQTVPALAVGNHSLKASFPGDPSYQASSSNATPLTLTITQASTFPGISGPATASANTQFNLTVLVDTTSNPFAVEGSVGNDPTGTVTLFNGTTQIGAAVSVAPVLDANGFSAAQAVVPVTLVSSSANITARYSGDPNYLSSTSGAFSVSVVTPSFTVTSASNPSVIAGSPATSVITVAPSNGFTGTVALTCSVAPTTLTSTPTCSLSPASIVLGVSQTSTLTMTTTATTSLVAYTVTVTGTSGATVITTPVTVTVQTPGTFTLASTAMTITAPGQSGTSTITATGTGGFVGAIALTCSVTGSTTVDLPTCSAGGPINLSGTTTPTGTATLTVNTTAASGIPFVPTNNVRPNSRWIVGTGTAAMLLMIMMLSFAPTRKRRPAIVLASLFIFVGLMVAGCGSSGGGGTSNPGTAVGSYTVTVTGTSGTHTATTTVTVTLQ